MDFFLNPDRLWNICWLVPLTVSLYIWAAARRRRALSGLLGHCHGQPPLGVQVRPGIRVFRMILLLTMMVTLTAAWARPSWGRTLISMSGAGRDIMVLFDVSRSMLATDIMPSRLQHAKQLVNEVTERMKGDRFGLISFAGEAFMECPLTIDRTSFSQILNMLDEHTIPVGGTDLERALKTALDHFKGAGEGHCAILLVTDGEEHLGQMKNVISQLNAEKIPIVTVGVGDPQNGGVIQFTGSDGKKHFITDNKGEIVKSKLNESALRQLAVETKGVYIHTTVTDMGEKTVTDYLKKLTPGANNELNKMLPIERWIWFVALAFVLFLIWLSLDERAKPGNDEQAFRQLLGHTNFGLLFCGVGMFCLNGAAPLHAQTADSAVHTPESALEWYNEGVRLQEKDSEKAVEMYETALGKPNPGDKVWSRTYQNLGVKKHKEGRTVLEEAAVVAQTDPDSSLSLIAAAEKTITEAESLYRESLRTPGAEQTGIAKNQQLLLNDTQRAATLRKVIEELKKQMEEAQKQSQEAKQDQQQANQSQNQQQKQEKQQQANQKTQQAKQSAKKMKDAAEKLQNRQAEQQAQSAETELSKAEEAQKNNQPEKAQQHLDNAAKQLNAMMKEAEQKKQDQQKNQDNKSKDGDKQEAADKDKKENEKKSDGSSGEEKKSDAENDEKGTAGEEKDEKIEGHAAEMLLREMAQEEQNLREEVLKKRLQGKERKVEKDW